MTALVATDVTETLNTRDRHVLGSLRMSRGSLAFGDGALTYPYGGVPMPAVGKFGMNREVSEMNITDASGAGYDFRYDQTNRTLKLFAQAPPIVYEEKHTAVAYTITLDYPAAFIINVAKSGQGYAWEKTGTAYASLTANAFCLASAMAEGERTQITTAGETDVVYVTYITQAWRDVWDNLVQEEAVTAADGNVTLTSGNKMLMFGYCYSSEATAVSLIPVDNAEAASTAAGEVAIKFNSATAQLRFNAAEDGDACVITYVKRPTSGFLNDRAVAEEDATNTSGINTLDNCCLAWGISGFVLANGQDSKRLITQYEDPATGEANINWGAIGGAAADAAPSDLFTIALDDDHAITCAAYVYGYPWEIPGVVPLEIRDGSILQATTLRFMAWGR